MAHFGRIAFVQTPTFAWNSRAQALRTASSPLTVAARLAVVGAAVHVAPYCASAGEAPCHLGQAESLLGWCSSGSASWPVAVVGTQLLLSSATELAELVDARGEQPAVVGLDSTLGCSAASLAFAFAVDGEQTEHAVVKSSAAEASIGDRSCEVGPSRFDP